MSKVKPDEGEIEKFGNRWLKDDRHLPGFWSYEFRKTRWQVFKSILIVFALIAFAIFGILSIYWGAVYYLNLKGINIWVVDFDQNLVGGPQMTAAVEQANIQPFSLYYELRPASDFPNGPDDIKDAIHNEKCWGAWIINANATTLWQQAVAQGNATYDPKGAMFIIFEEARLQLFVDEFISPQLTKLARQYSAQVSRQLTLSYLSANSSNAGALTTALKAPQALSGGIEFTTFNLIPFDINAAFATIQVGLIYLIIFTFFIVNFFKPTQTMVIGKLNLWSYVSFRIILPLIAYLILSLFYTLVNVAFQIPFDRVYGRGGIPLFWALNYCTMLAVGLALENVNNLLGQPWISIFLILWVITNVSIGFFGISVQATFYRYGYGFPFWHTVSASKHIIFGTYNHLGLNFGVLRAWVALSLIILPFGILWDYRKTAKCKWRAANATNGGGQADTSGESEKTVDAMDPRQEPDQTVAGADCPIHSGEHQRPPLVAAQSTYQTAASESTQLP